MSFENFVSGELKDVQSGQICSIKLKFQKFKVVREKRKFFIICEMFDGLNIVCSGSLDLNHENLSLLKQDDEIELKNVLVKFVKNRQNYSQNDLVLMPNSVIYLNDSFGSVKVLSSKKSPEYSNSQVFPECMPTYQIPYLSNDFMTYASMNPAFFPNRAGPRQGRIIRQCPKCHLQLVKSDACNMMICRCGTLQCYLCRAVVKDYIHFCDW
uniref:IBR domain-containing protein n=1 Tax=Panagrolaimus sp. JU765 TaxID=591449 RepID=A0AC34QC11_9BILA